MKKKKLQAALSIGIMLTATSAMASINEDIAECNTYADTMVQSHRNSSQQSQAIRGATGIVGAIIGGRDIGRAAESAIRGQGYGVSSDVRMSASRREQYFRQCMRDAARDRR